MYVFVFVVIFFIEKKLKNEPNRSAIYEMLEIKYYHFEEHEKVIQFNFLKRFFLN